MNIMKKKKYVKMNLINGKIFLKNINLNGMKMDVLDD